MARFTDRYGFSYFGGAIPGNITEDGAKFTLFDPQLLDRLLGAMEDHDHSGGEQLLDPAEAPLVDLQETGGTLPGGRTFHYAYTFVDRFGLETALGDEVDVITPAPIQPPLSPSVDADVGTMDVPVQLTANFRAIRLVREQEISLSIETNQGSPTITAASVTFVPDDIGSEIRIRNTNGDIVQTSTIASVTDGVSATMTEPATVNGSARPAQLDRYLMKFRDADVGRYVSIASGGANNITLNAKISELHSSTVALLDVTPAVSGERPMTIERGYLPNEYHQYALSVLVTKPVLDANGESTDAMFSQETTLSVPVPITPPANGIVTVTLPDMPAGGTHFQVWRKSIRDSAFTKIGVVGPAMTFTDDGTVKADPCACQPENMPQATNTTNGTNSVVVTVHDGAGAGDQATLVDPAQAARAWRLYRTEVSGVFSGRSLVAEIPRAADGTIPMSFTDIGDDLLPGRPPMISNTITPSQPITMGYGDLPELPDANLRDYTPWLAPNLQLFILVTTNQEQAWTPVLALPVPGSVRDEHVADDAAIAMGKIALDPLLGRVDVAEQRIDALETNGDGQGTDPNAVHYRGEWEQGPGYEANDLVRHNNAWYLSSNGQPPAPTGYSNDFNIDGPLVPSATLETFYNEWTAAGGTLGLSYAYTAFETTLGSVAFMVDSGGLPHDVSVTLAGDTTQPTFLYAGVSADRMFGYMVELSDTVFRAYVVVDQVATQIAAATLTFGFPDGVAGQRMRMVLTEAGTGYRVMGFIGENEMFSVPHTPERTVGPWLGLGALPASTGRWDDFTVAAPPGDAGEFDPAQWLSLTPPAPDLSALTARLDALETRAANALHYRGVFADTAVYVLNDLAVEAGQLYRSVQAQGPGAFDLAGWEVFPPSAA